jgi:hypothetical protein
MKFTGGGRASGAPLQLRGGLVHGSEKLDVPDFAMRQTENETVPTTSISKLPSSMASQELK